MTTEQQFIKWLSRTDKSLVENLQFAIKCWKSSEFTLSNKYDIILNWIAEEGVKLDVEIFPSNEYMDIMQLRAQPALINSVYKRKFIESLLKYAESAPPHGRTCPELLFKLLALEWMQDLLRSDFALTARIYGRLLLCYEDYLRHNSVSKQLQLTTNESDFFVSILNLFKEQIKNSGDLKDWICVYDDHIVQPLIEVFLVLRMKYEINFFEEIRELECTLRENPWKLVKELVQLPMHSAMVTIECAIVNRRIDSKFLCGVFHEIFSDIGPLEQANLALLKAAYIMDVFRKHNIVLNFEIDSKTAMNYLGTRVYELVSAHKDAQLREVLLLLCSILRLNPLILEHHVFEITTWMIVAPKTAVDDDLQTFELFEEYLSLLLEMFRKLSRAEKFVVNLLKALNQWLSKNQLSPTLSTSPKKLLKRKLKYSEDTLEETSKKTKMNEGSAFKKPHSNDDDADYIEMLFCDIRKQLKSSSKQAVIPSKLQNSFAYLHCAWPSSTIGLAFSRLITSLVVKASLTIWKTLLFSLKNQMDILSDDEAAVAAESNNVHFRLDFHAALLCQYFAGARPTEQYERYMNEILQLRQLTKDVLCAFGNLVLARLPFHKRRVNAFLECCYYASTFELMLAYYKPDGLEDESLKSESIIRNFQDFLQPKQWLELEQKIINASKNADCRLMYERIKLQRFEAQNLLDAADAAADQQSLIKRSANNIEEVEELLKVSTNGEWIISKLNRNEQIKLINRKMQDISTLEANNFLECISENAESLELLSYALFEYLCKDFKLNCKSSLLAKLDCNFETIRQYSILDHQNMDKTIKATVNVIAENVPLDYSIKNLPLESVRNILNLLPRLQLGFLRRQTKSLLFACYIALYRDLRMAQANVEATQLFDCLTDLLHFGHPIPIFRYFEMTKILQILPVNDCWDFYKFLFSTIKNEEKGTEEFLKSLEQLLSNSLSTNDDGSLNSDEERLLIIAIETLNALVGRRLYKHLHSFLIIYESFIYKHFDCETSTKKNKKFVERTLAGFAAYTKAIVKATLSNKSSNEKEKDETSRHHPVKPLRSLDDNFRKICKIFIGHSMDYRNPYALQLTQIALKNRKLLHLDLDEIELVLNTYWRQLNTDLQQSSACKKEKVSKTTEEEEVSQLGIRSKNSEILVKMIIENKTNEDFLLTLKGIGMNANDERSCETVLDLLRFIAKSNFSTIKGAIFNEQFKQITGSTLLQFSKNDKKIFNSEAPVLKILDCMQACIDNRTIPITPDTLDTIMGFLIDINIKKFPITDTNVSDFYSLHAAMTSLCSSIIKQRHILLMDRIPQFMHIFKDLLQSIVLYKSDRQKDINLNGDELNELAELALKLEVLMHAIATHRTDVKRVAPFILIFAINLMVSGKRPTTLYQKIKTHIEAICYSLIGICDHRAGNFILRCSNEASRQTYEFLVKEHKKYHKFKGKV